MIKHIKHVEIIDRTARNNLLSLRHVLLILSQNVNLSEIKYYCLKDFE